MFQCWQAGVSIFLSQIEMKSVPTNQVIASRETSPQLESSVLLREAEAPQSLMDLGLWGLYPLLTDATQCGKAACEHQ